MDADRANSIKGHSPLRPSKALRSALAQRGKAHGTITYFYSAKNDKDIVLASDLEFAHAILCEADESVKAYETDTDRVIAFIEKEGYIGSKPDALIHFWSGRTQYREVKYRKDQGDERSRLQAETQSRAAKAVGADWRWFSEKDVLAQERLLHDWLHIAPVLAQSRIEVNAHWRTLALWVLEASREGITLGELKWRAMSPWELVFSATFRLVQMGKLCTELQTKPLSADTFIMPRPRDYA